MTANAPTAIIDAYSQDGFVVYLRSGGGDGASADEYWCHAGEVWESAFDWTRHARPLDRLGPSGSPLHGFQSFRVPAVVVAPRNVHALVVLSQPASDPSNPPTLSAICAYTGPSLRMFSGGVV